MSQSAMPAIRNDVAQLLKPSKVTTFAALSKGTAIATSRGRLRTVAQRLANTPSSLKPQSETGTLATHSGKMEISQRT